MKKKTIMYINIPSNKSNKKKYYLYTRLIERDAKTISILAVVFHQLLECPECGATRYEEASLV